MRPLWQWVTLSVSLLFFLAGLCFFLVTLLFNQPNGIPPPCNTSNEIYLSPKFMDEFSSVESTSTTVSSEILTSTTKRPTFEDKLKLLPSSAYCGLQHTDDYFYDKNETSLDEFPWLAYIPITHPAGAEFTFHSKDVRCTGLLINNRYVLTNRFCGVGYRPGEVVYLGLYNRRENISCMDTADPSFQDCTEFRLEIKVSSWDYYNAMGMYLALLRLEKRVSYSDFVRPICLPLNETIRAKPGDEVVTSGWGAPRYNESAGLVKKRIKFTLKGIATLQSGRVEMYAAPKVFNQTVCPGDNGGPLMFSYKHQWFAEGIVDFDIMPCENPQYDVIIKRITPAVIQWILSIIVP